MPDKEKKKVGLLGKLKNIIFVDDDPVDTLPDYTDNEVKEDKPKVVIHDNPEESKVLPSRLDNDRVIDDIKIEPTIDTTAKIEEIVTTTTTVVEEPVEEQASPFLPFDEDEFRTFTSRVARNEAKAKEQVKVDNQNNRDRLNYNLPPNNVNTRTTMSSVNNTLVSGKKPFTPSPVISPVYGIKLMEKMKRKKKI